MSPLIGEEFRILVVVQVQRESVQYLLCAWLCGKTLIACQAWWCSIQEEASPCFLIFDLYVSSLFAVYLSVFKDKVNTVFLMLCTINITLKKL